MNEANGRMAFRGYLAATTRVASLCALTQKSLALKVAGSLPNRRGGRTFQSDTKEETANIRPLRQRRRASPSRRTAYYWSSSNDPDFKAFLSCRSETGLWRTILSSSFSKAAILADNCFTSALMASNSEFFMAGIYQGQSRQTNISVR